MKTKRFGQEQLQTNSILKNSISELKHALFSLGYFDKSNDVVYDSIREIETVILNLQGELETLSRWG
jgi:hypothetical protein